MKYGCLFWQNTINIGDDIQTYAQKRFLPQIDYLVDREHLSFFQSKDHEKVACIMNGWYLHSEGMAWPPSQDIVPLLTSMHFSPSLSFLKNSDENSAEIDYLRKNGPVGCRDQTTMQQLQDKNVPVYFSGCMTLTLEPFADVQKNDKVLLVDVDDSIRQYLESKQIQAEVWTHENQLLGEVDFDTRMVQVEQRLRYYQAAKLVITSRLHCCLPCLALGTPVLLVYEGKEKERYEGLLEYLHVASGEEILAGKWDAFWEEIPANKETHRPLAEKLKQQVREFVQHPETYQKEWSWDEYALYLHRMELMNLDQHREIKQWYEKLAQVEEAWGFVHKYEKDAKVLFDKIAVLEQERTQLQQQVEQEKLEQARLHQEEVLLQQEKTALAEENEKMRQQLQETQHQLQGLQSTLQEIYESTSWRVCKKVQRIRSRLRK